MRIGFIGTGSMGSILIEALLASHALHPEQIMAYNRTAQKAAALAARHPGLTLAKNNQEIAETCDVIFLCVKPKEYQTALQQFADLLSPTQMLITITSPVQLAELERCVPCVVVRAVPSITNAAHSGLVLLQFGSGVTSEGKEWVLHLFSHIGYPLETEERFLRITADITGCGPALISYLSQQMIRAAQEVGGISAEAATFLTSQMLIGFAELLKQEVFTLPDLQERVCVPGGITGEALAVLEQHIPGVFEQMFRKTQEKFAVDMQEMSQQLQSCQLDT